MTAINRFIGKEIGGFTIIAILSLDINTRVICCNDIDTEDGSKHLEAEHWLDENTFHFNSLYYDHDGNFIESERVEMPNKDIREFERVFCALDQE